jgi:hypothetical protein
MQIVDAELRMSDGHFNKFRLKIGLASDGASYLVWSKK